jgi:hypothetical protein
MPPIFVSGQGIPHDGRACDEIEAGFLHDGPAIKKLGVIQGLNALTPKEIRELRAFLYSL